MRRPWPLVGIALAALAGAARGRPQARARGDRRGRGVRWNADAWRAFVEKDVLASLRSLVESQRAFEARFLGARVLETDARARAVLARIGLDH